MPTSCNTHDYDGKLREKWFEIRPILLEKYLPNCLSFDDTIKQIEEWLDKKYFNVKRIGRARRSIRILTTQRRSNFDSRNDINVEELLPILWDQVKNQEDIHNTFYEQLCDITGGSCSQGRSTRLFQFLFLFDLPTNIDEQNKQQLTTNTISKTITDEISHLSIKEKQQLKSDQQQISLEQNTSDKIDMKQSTFIQQTTDEEQQSQVKENHEKNQQSIIEEKSTENKEEKSTENKEEKSTENKEEQLSTREKINEKKSVIRSNRLTRVPANNQHL